MGSALVIRDRKRATVVFAAGRRQFECWAIGENDDGIQDRNLRSAKPLLRRCEQLSFVIHSILKQPD
jgi:hypothetical protein